jgi:hypothetical protein
MGICGLLAVLASPASADEIMTFDIDQCHATGGCGNASTTPPWATVQLDDKGGGVIVVTVTPTDNGSQQNGFTSTGSGYTLAWDLNCTGCGTVSISGLTSGFDVVDCSKQKKATCHTGGTGDWKYAVDCPKGGACGTGGNHPYTMPVEFTISATHLTLADFVSNGTYFFSSDLCYGVAVNGTCRGGKTGDSGAEQGHQLQVPEPMTLSLFGVGLLGVAVMRRRRHTARNDLNGRRSSVADMAS